MKNKALALSLLVLAILACSLSPGVTSNELKPLATNTALPTETPRTPTGTPQASVASETLTVVGNWNLRPNLDGSGQSLGVVYDGAEIIVIMSADGWALVQTVEEDPGYVLTGCINLECCNEK